MLIFWHANRIQEAHPLKQGLKQEALEAKDAEIKIQEAHPLKQGLKRSYACYLARSPRNSRGASIKTRIETLLIGETTVLGCSIQEAHPLKQGLKPLFPILLIQAIKGIQEAHPLKQGLKQEALEAKDAEIKDSRGASIKTRIETI